MSYFISNYKGELLAHDIPTEAEAQARLNDFLTENPEEAKNEWEVLEAE